MVCAVMDKHWFTEAKLDIVRNHVLMVVASTMLSIPGCASQTTASAVFGFQVPLVEPEALDNPSHDHRTPP
jgi:hypothetical protein